MNTLQNELPIETWKNIANKVQTLYLEGYSEEIFLKNLMKLRKFLSEEGIDNSTLERKPQWTKQIGAASLLQSIYDIKVGLHNKKATFYENIYALEEIGIKKMIFKPFPVSYNENAFLQVNGYECMQKFLTDGEFVLSRKNYTKHIEYSMENIKNFNYLLQAKLIKEGEKITLHSSTALLTNFDAIGSFPSRDAFLTFDFPKKEVSTQLILNWDQDPYVKQVFETYDREKSSYAKRFVFAEENFYKTKGKK